MPKSDRPLMDSRRLSYLRALDIDVWERRDRPAEESRASRFETREPAEAERDAVSAESRVPSYEPRPASAELHRDPGLVTREPAEVRRTAASAESRIPSPGSRFLSSPPPASETLSLDWDALEQAVRVCTKCELHASRTQAVFGVGNRQAKWMVIGEAPGADEDRQGEPFVGRAGQLLNSMLRAMGLAREQVFIANILKSRPPGNRDPRPEEVRACIPYLFRQIELVNPTLLLCVGRIAAQTLLETDTPIGKLRGRLHRLGSGRPMIVTYHPAYLLRSPGEKRKAWADLVLAMQTFDQLTNAAGQAR